MVELIRKNPANYEYFFDNLNDPAWLPVLRAEKFFLNPAEPERGEGWIRYPFWPESRFLARVAAEAPDEVFEIAMGIPAAENVRVHEDLLRIAVQLSGRSAAKLVRKEAAWLRSYEGHLMSLPSAAGDVIAHLAEAGELGAALEFADAILAIVEVPDTTAVRGRAKARIEEYAYGKLLERAWPAVVAADARWALRFLCERLGEVVKLGYIDENGYDSSSVFRPAIEPHGQNLGHSILDLLVDVVRDQAVTNAESEPGRELVLRELLSDRPGSLFRRLALHVVRERGSVEDVATRLADADLVWETTTWHEYGELLRHRFAELGDEDRERVLALLAAGPGAELTPALEEQGVTAERVMRSNRSTRLKRYDVIAGSLSGGTRDAYEELVAEFGRPEHPTFLSYSWSWTGPTSPYSSKELRELGPVGVARALREWLAPEGPESPSPEGLGRILEQVVAEDAPEYAAAAEEFTGLEATYVRAVVSGLESAAKKGVVSPWDPVLTLCEWIVSQPRSPADRSDDHERDPHWGWARKAVASLLSQGFAEGPTAVPFDERPRVWALLAELAEDPDPTPQHEERYGEEDRDFSTLAINTTRGEAMHAVVRYAFWVERELAGFDGSRSIPEVAALLERRLDVDIEPSRAVRSVYGQWFAQFVRIDAEWARRLVPLVFPDDPAQTDLFASAWDAYVLYNRPYTDVFRVLSGVYAQAVAQLDARIERDWFAGDPRKRLGDHVLTFRIRGELPEDEDLFVSYWQKAPAPLRKEVLTSAGWSLAKTEALEADVLSRLQSVWAWILEHESQAESAALAGFGAWLETRAVQPGWLLDQALAVLQRGIYLEPDFKVYEAAAAFAPDYPEHVVRLIELMVRNDPEDWSLHGSVDEVREALSAVLARGDEDARRRAAALVDVLVGRGVGAFRELGSADG
jgi:hypothetical protein